MFLHVGSKISDPSVSNYRDDFEILSEIITFMLVNAESLAAEISAETKMGETLREMTKRAEDGLGVLRKVRRVARDTDANPLTADVFSRLNQRLTKQEREILSGVSQGDDDSVLAMRTGASRAAIARAKRGLRRKLAEIVFQNALDPRATPAEKMNPRQIRVE